MSEMETHIGMLEKIPIEHGMTVEEKAEEICKNCMLNKTSSLI